MLYSKHLQTIGAFVLVLSLVIATSATAQGEYDWNSHTDGTAIEQIPTSGRQCSSCHAGPGVDDAAFVVPVVSVDREVWTAMGWDFLFLDSVERDWRTLGAMNSDGDGCSNRYEVEDAERDPNDGADCTLPIDEESWSTLKSLFSDDR